MLNETQAKSIASALNGTFVVPEKIDPATQSVAQEARGKRATKISKHVTNGVARFQVHVTHEDKWEPPYTIGSMSHDAVPLA